MTTAVWAAYIQAASVIIAALALIRTIRSEAKARALSQQRDLDARRHDEERARDDRLAEIRINFLRDAYLKLSLISSIRSIGSQEAVPMVQALKDIQLLGTPEQVNLADEAA